MRWKTMSPFEREIHLAEDGGVGSQGGKQNFNYPARGGKTASGAGLHCFLNTCRRGKERGFKGFMSPSVGRETTAAFWDFISLSWGGKT
jgi:hypothetical protein